jgi:hypothetical protein
MKGCRPPFMVARSSMLLVGEMVLVTSPAVTGTHHTAAGKVDDSAACTSNTGAQGLL